MGENDSLRQKNSRIRVNSVCFYKLEGCEGESFHNCIDTPVPQDRSGVTVKSTLFYNRRKA